MIKAEFKTAYGQREVVLDVKVAADLKVGQVFSVASETATGISNSATPATGNYIVAQSDMTMNRRDYSVNEYTYDDKVSASTSAKKKIAAFLITDVNDIMYKTV